MENGFNVGDKVRFVTTEPQYCAEYDDGILTVEYICGSKDVDLSYPHRVGLMQTVSVDDIERV